MSTRKSALHYYPVDECFLHLKHLRIPYSVLALLAHLLYQLYQNKFKSLREEFVKVCLYYRSYVMRYNSGIIFSKLFSPSDPLESIHVPPVARVPQFAKYCSRLTPTYSPPSEHHVS
jgi:hypothetical protein